jgi:hypothetical protein
MKLRHELEKKYEILGALASKDKKELKEASYVAYNDVIEFPKPVAYAIPALKRIIRQVEKEKLRGDKIMVGLEIQIPLKEYPELRKPYGKSRKIKGVKTLKKKYSEIK